MCHFMSLYCALLRCCKRRGGPAFVPTSIQLAHHCTSRRSLYTMCEGVLGATAAGEARIRKRASCRGRAQVKATQLPVTGCSHDICSQACESPNPRFPWSTATVQQGVQHCVVPSGRKPLAYAQRLPQ